MRAVISDDTSTLRCPACGQRVEGERTSRCNLCHFPLGTTEHATGDDITPFAEAYSRGESGWLRMCEWVWFAGAGRIKHLGLMRASAASRSFFRGNILLMAAGVSLVLATHVGWRAVTANAALESTGSVKPRGEGWLHVAQTRPPHRVTAPTDAAVDLWWSPPQAIIAAAAGFIGGFVALYAIHFLVRIGVGMAHRAKYRSEERMTAALHYGTAWGVPMLVSAAMLALRPLSRIGAIERISWIPRETGFEAAAGLVTAAAAVMWWFWMARLVGSAPADSRSRVGAFVGVGVPLVVCAVAAGLWYGMGSGLQALFTSWTLHF